MEYEVGDYVMFDILKTHKSFITGLKRYGSVDTNYKVVKVDPDQHFYYLNFNGVVQCVHHSYFYTKSETRKLKLNKILSKIK